VLRRQAKSKSAAVITEAKKSLQRVVKESLKVVTSSTDQRQRARAKLVTLRSHQGDEVALAEAALNLAKINKATHVENVEARRKARMERVRAMHKIKFARTMLASRLKAIHSTAMLAADKAELQSRAVVAEAQELLSRAKQQVLMALDAADASVPLEEVVGKEDVVETVQEPQPGLRGVVSRGGMQDFSQMEDTGAAESREEEELVGRSMVQSKVDTIYTAKMHRCVFPFKNAGQTYYHCKVSTEGRWCATQVDAQQRVQKWDYCVLNQHAVSLAKEAAMAAAKIEINRVLAATGAKITPEALQESLRAAAAAQQEPAREAAAETAAAGKVAAGPRVMASKEAKSKVDEMIDDDASEVKEQPRVKTLRRVKTLHSVVPKRERLRREEPAVQTLNRDAEERSAGKALEDEVGAKLLQQGSPRPVSNKEEEETLKLLLESGNADLLA
jgi:hypothetical protein